MAHVLVATNNLNTSLTLFSTEISTTNTVRNAASDKRRRFGPSENRSAFQYHRYCCSTSGSSRSSSSSISTSISADQKSQIDDFGANQQQQQKYEDKERLINVIGDEQYDYLVCEYGWRVRRLVEKADEIKNAARVQAEAFHVPVSLFNELFFQFFLAEVLSGLLYKLNNSPPNRYACLVAETATKNPESPKQVVGVVDVTVLRDEDVLKHLPSVAQEYLYISGIAVSTSFRRRKIATALLKACDVLSILWGFEFLALRAYEEDWGARKLYSNAGYNVVSRDPPWMSTWIGRKCRVLMIKRRTNLPI